jgi:porin
MRYKWIITGLIKTIGISSALAQGQITENKSPFSFETSYIGDIVSNFRGGIKTGTTYLGLANIKAGFDTETADFWKGGQFFINFGNTHGGEPSASFVGDFQGVSNIEAGDLTFLYEFWYKQSFGKFDISLGLQDLNANYATSENGALFTNSSFGIHSSIADNILSPIFPLTALGVSAQWNISDSYLLESAIFDGTPDDFEKNPYNTEWTLSKNQGFLAVTEFQLKKSLLKGKTGSYKFGAYYHQHCDSIDAEQRNRGIYFVVDQQISEGISIFSQVGFSPKSLNHHNHYYSLGIHFLKLFYCRPNDQVGLAVAYAGIDGNSIGSETAIELTYKFYINKNIYIKPDIQYIINPAGTETKLDNALVGFLRFGINFNNLN